MGNIPDKFTPEELMYLRFYQHVMRFYRHTCASAELDDIRSILSYFNKFINYENIRESVRLIELSYTFEDIKKDRIDKDLLAKMKELMVKKEETKLPVKITLTVAIPKTHSEAGLLIYLGVEYKPRVKTLLGNMTPENIIRIHNDLLIPVKKIFLLSDPIPMKTIEGSTVI